MIRIDHGDHRSAFDRLEAAIEALSNAGGFDVTEVTQELAAIVDRRATAERLRLDMSRTSLRPISQMRRRT